MGECAHQSSGYDEADGVVELYEEDADAETQHDGGEDEVEASQDKLA